jgi:hypothetical protein
MDNNKYADNNLVKTTKQYESREGAKWLNQPNI